MLNTIEMNKERHNRTTKSWTHNIMHEMHRHIDG